MDLYCKRFLFVALTLTTLLAFPACEKTGMEGEQEENPMNFFSDFAADKLGTTAIIFANPVRGMRGETKKMLDLSVPDKYACPLLVSCRTEYSTNQATVSQTIGPPSPISGATNAAPISITTPAPHGLASTMNVQIAGVIGNIAANGAWVITVTGLTTFTLNGSDGTLSGAYTGDGIYRSLSIGGTGTGQGQIGAPVVGLLQWGVGGGHQQVEFDIPAPRFPLLLEPFQRPDFQPMNNIGNGIQVPISGSHVSLTVRHDGNMSPINNPGLDFIGNLSPVKVICFVTPGSVSASKVERTIFAVGGNAAGPISNLAPNATVIVNIPPMARTVRLTRFPINTALNVQFRKNDGATYYRQVSVGVNDESPIDVDGMADGFAVLNSSAIDIRFLQAVFDVTPM
jgi:hypothetical protein